MYKRYIFLVVFLYYAIVGGFAMAKETPAPSRLGPASAEFQRVLDDWKTLVGELGTCGRNIAPPRKRNGRRWKNSGKNCLRKAKP